MATDRNKRRILRVGADQVMRALQLPEGMQIAAITSQNDPLCFELVVLSEDFSPVPADSCAPFLHRRLEYVLDDPDPVFGQRLKITYIDPENEREA